jgi:hypothetical protein
VYLKEKKKHRRRIRTISEALCSNYAATRPKQVPLRCS